MRRKGVDWLYLFITCAFCYLFLRLEKKSREGETIPYVACSNSGYVIYIRIPFAHFSLPARDTLQRLSIRCTYLLSVSGDIVADEHDFLPITDGYCHDHYPNRRCLLPCHVRSPKDIIDHLRTQILLDSFRCCGEFRVQFFKRGTNTAFSQSFQYDDITVVPVGSSANVPTPYLDLNYIGWTVSDPIEIANETVSTLQTSSPPNTIFFNGNDDTRVHSFSVA